MKRLGPNSLTEPWIEPLLKPAFSTFHFLGQYFLSLFFSVICNQNMPSRDKDSLRFLVTLRCLVGASRTVNMGLTEVSRHAFHEQQG